MVRRLLLRCLHVDISGIHMAAPACRASATLSCMTILFRPSIEILSAVLTDKDRGHDSNACLSQCVFYWSNKGNWESLTGRGVVEWLGWWVQGRVGGGFHCGDLSWKSTCGQVNYKNNGPSPWGLRLNSSMRASRARTWGPITSALFFKIDESKWNKWLNDIKTDCWTTSESQTKCKFYYITCYSWLAEILKNRSVRSVLGLMRFKYHGLVRVESISPSCGGGVGILDRLLAFHNSNSLLQHNPAYVTFYLHQWWELNPWRKEGRRGVERRSS